MGKSGANIKSVLRHDHLKNLVLWSTDRDTPNSSLDTLFGRLLAADEEASGIVPDTELVSCQRCETILQPGFNCNVRIEKVSTKKKHIKNKKKSNISLPQNNVVYYCNFCSHRNLKRGTAKGQMKEIYPSKPKTAPPKMKKEMKMMMTQETQSNILSSPQRTEKDQLENCVVNTPKPILTLEREKRIRKSKCKKPIQPESVSKETVNGSNKRTRDLNNLKIPFRL